MLYGTYTPTIDVQCRISIPSKFRSELGEQLIIVRQLKQNCLRIYSAEAWERNISSLRSHMVRGSYENMLRAYYSRLVDVTPDSLGRVRIPKDLWESIGVDFDKEETKEICVIGCREFGEIWRKTDMEIHTAEIDLDALDDEINGMLME